MDSVRRNREGYEPIRATLEQVRAINDKTAYLFARQPFGTQRRFRHDWRGVRRRHQECQDESRANQPKRLGARRT